MKTITGLWERDGKSGKYYGSVTMKASDFKAKIKEALEGEDLKDTDFINLLVFRNVNKKTDRSPDITIVLAKGQESKK